MDSNVSDEPTLAIRRASSLDAYKSLLVWGTVIFTLSMIVTVLLTAYCVLVLSNGCHSTPTPPSSSSLVVRLTSGSFQGIATGAPNTSEIWFRLPFAQPPIDNFRFKAPIPITSPTAEVKNATQFGNACPQIPSDTLGAPMGEDCLYLNVSGL